MNRSVVAASSSLLFAAVFAACGGKSGTPNTPDNTAPPPTYAPLGSAPTATTTAPPPSTTTTAPPPPTTATATATTPPPPATADLTMLQPLLAPLQQKFAVAGAKPDGAPISGMVQQGQSIQGVLQLQPSGTKCYTIVAVAPPTVTDIGIDLVATPPPPLPPTLIAQSQSPGNPVALAPKPNCYKNLLPIVVPATVKITVRQGSGPVIAQVYAK